MNTTLRTCLLAGGCLALGLLMSAIFAPAPAVAADPIARGNYLVETMGCHDCHTPWTMTEQGPAPDRSRALMGHPHDVPAPARPADAAWPVALGPTNTAFAGPWGISFAANLTPDRDTGLGAWTAEEFVAAMRTGRHRGTGRQILPPMPWPGLAQATDADLRAMFAYLQSLPARQNAVPFPQPPAAK